MSFQYSECEYVLAREEQLLDIANHTQAAEQPLVLKLVLANMIPAESKRT